MHRLQAAASSRLLRMDRVPLASDGPAKTNAAGLESAEDDCVAENKHKRINN